jgi:hypothetical protein
MLDKMFYGYREPAWHKLGFVSQEQNTAQEVLDILNGGYYVEKRPVTLFLNGVNQEVGDYALVRSPMPEDPREYVFGYVAKGYNILNPLDIANLFDANVKTNVETLGFLGHGEKIFLTWEMPTVFVGNKNDEIKNYGFIACGYDGKFGASLYLTTTRVVCQNTFNIAVQVADNSKNNHNQKVWTGRHNSLNLARDLGAWLEHVQERASQKQQESTDIFNAMANFDFCDEEEVDDLLSIVYPDPFPVSENMPSIIKSEKEEKRELLLEKASRDRQLVKEIFDGAGTAIDATAWGLFNSVTEYENWGRATRRPAEYSIILGDRNQKMNYAHNSIVAYMENNK